MGDLRYAVRSLVKSPGFSAIAILTLAVGIGATSAIFSFVDAVLLRPLPYADPDRILLVMERPPGGGRNVISALNFLDWRSDNRVFASIAAATGGAMTLSGVGEPVLIRAGRVSASYFDVFKVAPAIGRVFQPGEDEAGRDHVVVLSHKLWTTQFGSDPAIVGRSLTLDGENYTVIGVMPPGSAFDRGFNQMWRPLAFKPAELTRNFHWLQAYARLAPGVTMDQARAQMDAIGARIARDYPDSNKGWGVSVDRYADLVVGPQLRSSLVVLLAAVGTLLLIGCANVANLALARGTAREREVAVRAALGASRRRLVRQFLTENFVLSTIGGLFGLALGFGLMNALKLALPPFSLPRDANVTMDGGVLAFTLLLSMVTGIVFGLAPALHSTGPDLSSAMKEGGRGAGGDSGRRRLRSTLVVVEVALAFVLLVGSGLLVRSFFQMMRVNLGFDSTNVITMGLPIAGDAFPDSSQLNAYQRQIASRVEAVPAVRSVAVASTVPMRGWGNGMPFLIAGRPVTDRANRRSAGFKQVDAAYFQTIGMKLAKGRGFTAHDTKGSRPVMVINKTMAARFFADEEPIGQRILVQEIIPGRPALGPEISWEVVGVVEDEKTGDLDGNSSAGMYVPLEQSPSAFVSLVVRAQVDPTTLQRALAQAVHEVNKDQPLSDILTLDQIKDESAATSRLRTTLLAIFASVALLLSAIGIYGVIAYTVVQRTHEMGIRAALGATSGALLTLVLAQGMALAAVGLVVGLAGALAMTRLLSTLLFGVSPRDPVTMAAAASILAAVALLACYLPARRAAALDPLAALRES